MPVEPQPAAGPSKATEPITDVTLAAAFPPKFDVATDLSGMLSMEGPRWDVPEADDWAVLHMYMAFFF